MGQRLLFLFLSGSFLMACSSSPPAPEVVKAPDAAHGRSLYQQQCAGCHDAGKNAPSLRDPEDWDIKHLNAPGIIQKHQSMRMPPGFKGPGRLTPEDERDVLFYLRTAIDEAELKY
jgi:mono/diheme cytochrome c family protein